MNPEWRRAWIADPATPIPITWQKKASVPTNGALFHAIAARFAEWLTKPANLVAASILETGTDLWGALWDHYAKTEILGLLNRQGHGPLASEHLAGAFKAFCARLAEVRRLSPAFKNWRSVLLTEEFTMPKISLPARSGSLDVVGRPDSVRCVGNSLQVVDYKLSRGADLKTDLLQGVIYCRLVEAIKPGLQFSLCLEYYEPELHLVEQTQNAAAHLFNELVQPVVEEITAALAKKKPLGTPVAATSSRGTSSPAVAFSEKSAGKVTNKARSAITRENGSEADLSSSIEKAYASFDVGVKVIGRIEAPQLVRYKLKLAEGVTFNKVRSHSVNLKIVLAIDTEPLVSPGPGYVQFDVLRTRPETVLWTAMMDRPELKCHPSLLAIPAGVKIDGTLAIADLADSNSAHALIAGTSGSGKSELLKSLVATLVRRNSPDTLKLSLIDPKRVTFGGVPGNPYLSGSVIFDLQNALACLRAATADMDERYDVLLKEGITKLGDRINQGRHDIPFHVIVFDEFADLINSGKEEKKEFELLVKRLSAKGRAAGVHLVVATQRPDRDIVSGQLKANLPLKICLKVTTAVNSQIVIDEPGGESLRGKGDLLFSAGGGIERAQSPFLPQEDFIQLFAGRAR